MAIFFGLESIADTGTLQVYRQQYF